MRKSKKKGVAAKHKLRSGPPAPTTTGPTVPAANIAFRAVREALGKTQSQLAASLELSVPLIQAIEGGQRELTKEVARRLRNKFGVHPGSLKPGSMVPIDLTGARFTEQSLGKVFSMEPQQFTEADHSAFCKPSIALAKAAARGGSLLAFGAAFREKMTQLIKDFDLRHDLQVVLTEEAGASRTQVVRLDWLRKQPEMMKLFSILDDPARSGDEMVRLVAGPEHAPMHVSLFSSDRWIPDPSKLDECARNLEEQSDRPIKAASPSKNRK